jgi:hypothetical protein
MDKLKALAVYQNYFRRSIHFAKTLGYGNIFFFSALGFAFFLKYATIIIKIH